MGYKYRVKGWVKRNKGVSGVRSREASQRIFTLLTRARYDRVNSPEINASYHFIHLCGFGSFLRGTSRGVLAVCKRLDAYIGRARRENAEFRLKCSGRVTRRVSVSPLRSHKTLLSYANPENRRQIDRKRARLCGI